MKVLVTGSSGHLGEALVRQLRGLGHDVVALDILESPFTTHVGSITDKEFVKRCMPGVSVVYHTATLHKPHIESHSRSQFVDTNIVGTLNLLEEAILQGEQPTFIFTSTTSVFGDALEPSESSDSAVWITEDTVPIPKNIYGVTKIAAEDMCQLFHRNHGLVCLVLRTSRFFPEEDDDSDICELYSGQNLKANEYLHRRVEIQDVVDAHLLAAQAASRIGFGKYIVSATTPFQNDIMELKLLRENAPAVVSKYFPTYVETYQAANWKMFPRISRVYDNTKARVELGWSPKYDFGHILSILDKQIASNTDESGFEHDITSPLAVSIGRKYYHR